MPKSTTHITEAYIARIESDSDVFGYDDFLRAVKNHYDPTQPSGSVDVMANSRAQSEPTIGYLFNILRDSDLIGSDDFFEGVLEKYLKLEGKGIDDVWEAGYTTLLQYACVKSPARTVQLLIKKGADINRGPHTPMDMAVQFGNQAAKECLRLAGAKPSSFKTTPPPVIYSSYPTTPRALPQAAVQTSQSTPPLGHGHYKPW